MPKINPPTLQLYTCIKYANSDLQKERNACWPPHNHSFCSASIFSSCLTCSFLHPFFFKIFFLSLSSSFPRFPSSLFPSLFPFRSFFLCHSVVISFCLFSSLSPALLLTSSAVLRPLHEANAHSGLAVAACMRSTGGPIKRRQEQEMQRETGSARPQGPRRYHHCPPPPPHPPTPYVSAAVPVSKPPQTPFLSSSLPQFVCVPSSSCP